MTPTGRCVVVLAALVAACGPSGLDASSSETRPEPPRIVAETTSPDGTRVRFRLVGVRVDSGPVGEAEGRRQLRVAVEGASAPLLGRYRREGADLVFEPSLALVRGTAYEASAPDARPIVHVVPRSPQGAPRVLASAPHTDRIPANTLRLHLTFSEPMAGGPELFERVRLEDATGAPIEGAFRRTERWSPDRRVLTLVFHPGRIKRDIPYADGLPSVLTPGERVTLVVEPLRDAEGERMDAAFRRSFEVTAPDAAPPDLAAVRVSSPNAGTREPLLVRFDEAVEPEVARGAIRVSRGPSDAVGCRWSARDADHVMACAPSEPWPDGALTVEVGCALEDYAGNTPVAPFDAPASAARPCEARRLEARVGGAVAGT